MSVSMSSLSNLPRNPLSVILSYLQQEQSIATNNTDVDVTGPHNRDAISLLITNKRFVFAILPLFRLPKHMCKVHQLELKSADRSENRTIVLVETYRFVKLPIQDPRTLLNRLNTRRLRKRIIYIKQYQQEKGDLNEHQTCYQFGRTIDELALEEWLLLQIHHIDRPKTEADEQLRVLWPTHLELLRFNNCYYDDAGSKDTKEKTMKLKNLFHLRDRKQKYLAAIDEANVFPHCNEFEISTTLLSSYPRSGNTLMRTLLERITSLATGSDTRPDRSLSIKLALEHDLVGEGLTGKDSSDSIKIKPNTPLSEKRKVYQTTYDPIVNIVKTHFPERKGWRPVIANRVVLLVRNPYDAIDSYWNLCCTNTHTSSLDESIYQKYAAKFESMARHEINIWCNFHYYWIDLCAREDIPLLIVRFEDLILNTEEEMRRVVSFLLDKELDSFWIWRISHATRQTAKKGTTALSRCTASLGSYRPRSSNGGLSSIGKSLAKNRYSQRVLCHMNDVAASLELKRKMTKKDSTHEQTHMTLLQRFGYDIVDQKFPSNFEQSLASIDGILIKKGKRQKHGSIKINSTAEIRNNDDPFGRAMTAWRRGETNDDKEPFQTAQK